MERRGVAGRSQSSAEPQGSKRGAAASGGPGEGLRRTTAGPRQARAQPPAALDVASAP